MTMRNRLLAEAQQDGYNEGYRRGKEDAFGEMRKNDDRLVEIIKNAVKEEMKAREIEKERQSAQLVYGTAQLDAEALIKATGIPSPSTACSHCGLKSGDHTYSCPHSIEVPSSAAVSVAPDPFRGVGRSSCPGCDGDYSGIHNCGKENDSR